MVAAIGYTGANTCLRYLAATSDTAWVTCMKAAVATVALGPWVLYRSAIGRSVMPHARALISLMLAGLIGQFGNLGMQYALEVVGLAVTVPVLFGMILATSALLGRVALGEHVSRRSIAAIGLSIVSVTLLGWGAGAVQPGPAPVAGPLLVASAVGVACLAGVAFAIMSVVVRVVVSGVTSTVTIVFVTTAVGTVVIGALSVVRIGTAAMLATPPLDLAVMIAAGAFNLLAYLALVKGLQLTTVVHANVLNASQVAMCAVVGVVLFSETLSLVLVLGITLTIVATVLIDRPRDDQANLSRRARA